MKNYKELDVWKKAMNLVMEVYKAARIFPQEERYGLTSQIQRAATSIPANIAEGWGRGSTKEYIQFLRMARGSLMELETHIIVAQRLGYLKKETWDIFQKEIESLGKMINALVQALRSK